MANYSLTFPENGTGERETIHFESLSLDAALRVAKMSGRGNWADLAEDGRPVCKIHLVSETGVWQISQHPDRIRRTA